MSNFLRRVSLKPKKRDGTEAESPRDASPASSTHPDVTSPPPDPKAKHTSTGLSSISSDGGDDGPRSRKSLNFPGREMLSKLGPRHRSTDRSATSDKGDKAVNGTHSRDSQDASRNKAKRSLKKQHIEHRDAWHQNQTEELRKRQQEEVARMEREDTPENRKKYGYLPANMYAGNFKGPTGPVKLDALSKDDIGKEVVFRARIHHYRKMSSSLAFFILRQQMMTVQGVVQETKDVSKHMVYFCEHIPLETIVLVKGTIQKPKSKEGEVLNALIHNLEIMVSEMHVVSSLTEHIPFSVNEAEVTEAEANEEGSGKHHVSERARLQSRILDLRTTASHAIFRVQAGVCNLFRGQLDSEGFMEIHTPKLQGGATESGASVFKIDYFGRQAFLAQSPQLAKQMSIAADFGKVYEIGAVFRAENSNTHRHLTEYTGLDIEMQIDEHYHEALRTIDRTLKNIFKGIYTKYRKEVEIIKHHYPSEDLVFLDETPVLKFKDAIRLLNSTGWRTEEGHELPEDEDLGTRDEIQMGRVIKEKYGTDYYILDKFPKSARPFYTMPDPEDPTYTNSFDIFVRGQEIISGGERIHDAAMLEENMKKMKVDPGTMEEYMQGFEWGAPPHAGVGVGLERIVMLMLQLGDIRHASMYPRDPRSLPAKPQQVKLRHPEASTLHPPWEAANATVKELQPLEKLIANYGDASNTSWLEPRNSIWRDGETGAAVGYVSHHGFAITVGDPLCNESQYAKTIASYLEYLRKETELKPLWLLCGSTVEEVLAGRFDWRTFSCAAEQRVDLKAGSKVFDSVDVQKKIRHASRSGIKIKDIEMGNPVPQDIVNAVDQRIKDWIGNRKSHQHVHLTDVHPWQDMPHRAYHVVYGPNNTIDCIVVMAILSPQHGWQVKYALDFPGSTSGAIEAGVVHALKVVQGKGANEATFGGGASSDFTPGHNLKGAKVKLLSRAYHTIANDLKLTQKSEFREKLGAHEDPIFIGYPPKGLGPKGVQAILSFFED